MGSYANLSSWYVLTMISAQQSRMARAALGWSIRDAAKAAVIGTNTLVRLESGQDVFTSTATALRTAYERGGLVFMDREAPSLGGGPGVRLVDHA